METTKKTFGDLKEGDKLYFLVPIIDEVNFDSSYGITSESVATIEKIKDHKSVKIKTDTKNWLFPHYLEKNSSAHHYTEENYSVFVDKQAALDWIDGLIETIKNLD